MNPAEFTDRPLSHLRFVALDFEATGAAPGHDRIIEIGAASFRVGDGGRVSAGATYRQLVNPGRDISPAIQALTGLDNDALRLAPRLEDVWEALCQFLSDSSEGAQTVVLAHKAQSDLHFLAAAAKRLRRRLEPVAFVCTLHISRSVFPSAPSHRLGRLISWLGCAPMDPTMHRALPDALHTRNLFERAVKERAARTLRDLGVHEAEPVPPPDHFDIALPARLGPIMGAIEHQVAVTIVYRGGSKGKEPRVVTPLAFYNHAGRLWLRATCHHDEVVKSFRCDRIRVCDLPNGPR